MTIDLSTYAGLQAAVIEIMERTGDAAFAANVPAAVKLAEAKLNRKLGAIESDATLTGTIDSRVVSISSLSIVQPVALFLARAGQNEAELDPMAPENLPYASGSSVPRYYAINGSTITFDRPLLEAYPFRFRYREKLALATTSPNWLLTNHPDVYLAATMVWGFNFQEDKENFPLWKGLLEEAIPEIKHTLSQSKRGTLVVPPQFNMGNRRAYNIETDA